MRLALVFALFITAASAQFQIQDAHTTASLRGIHSLGGGVAWASGTGGTVLRTEDGGFVWQLCAIPPGAEKLDFRGIQGFDHNTAIVMSSGKGDLSRLYKTTDGCQTWKLLFANPEKDGFWDAMVLTSKEAGYLLGDPVRHEFYLAQTQDGGEHWQQQHNANLKAEPSEQGAFAASNSSLSVSSNGHVFFASGGTGGAMVFEEDSIVICVDDCSEKDKNLDGHLNSWAKSGLPVGNSKESSGVFSLGEGAFVAVGGDYVSPGDWSSSAAYRDHDHWTRAKTPPHGYRSSVAYDPTHKTWITVGPNGTDISTDDGRNWRPLKPSSLDTPDADQQWNALSLPYVVGPHGRIGRLREDALK